MATRGVLVENIGLPQQPEQQQQQQEQQQPVPTGVIQTAHVVGHQPAQDAAGVRTHHQVIAEGSFNRAWDIRIGK
jgi:hypothetical protein